MGILNVTPDSFYDGGFYKDKSLLLNQVESMLEAGASFIDIGACSSKPNAEPVTEALETQRILPIVELLIEKFPDIILSIDSYRSAVAKACVDAGAAIINDISAGHLDPEMLRTIAELKVPYIMMHMRGTPQTMQKETEYKDIIKELLFYFSERLQTARALGIKDIILDPGFGFAKTTAQNFYLLQRFEQFKITDLPLLAGVSRKSMIYKTLENTPDKALNGTTALHMVALQKGASILRVHDVKEAVECVKLHEQLMINTIE